MALPQKHRLRGVKVFERLYRQGRRFHGTWLTLRVHSAVPALLPMRDSTHPASSWRCAVVVSSKVSKRAVRRNHLRRLLHRQILRHSPTPPSPIWLILSLKPGSSDAEEALLLGECLQLLRKAELS